MIFFNIPSQVIQFATFRHPFFVEGHDSPTPEGHDEQSHNGHNRRMARQLYIILAG